MILNYCALSKLTNYQHIVLYHTDCPCYESQNVDVVKGEWTTINCTVSCNAPQRTPFWFTQNDTSVFGFLPESAAIGRNPPVGERCGATDIHNETYRLELLVTDASLNIQTFRCVANHVCVTSVTLNLSMNGPSSTTLGMYN